jgi:hypothetical protein
VHVSPETNKKNLSLPIADKLKHLDPLGTVIFLGSIVSLLLALQWGGQTLPWSSPTIIGLFVTFGVCGIAFITLQWRLEEYATLPLRVLKIRSIYMGALVLFFLGIASISVSPQQPVFDDVVTRTNVTKLAFYLPLYFQSTRGISATHSGINMIAYVAPSIVAIGITGALVSKYGYYVSPSLTCPFIIIHVYSHKTGPVHDRRHIYRHPYLRLPNPAQRIHFNC